MGWGASKEESIPHRPGDWKAQDKMLADLVPGEDSLSASQMVALAGASR